MRRAVLAVVLAVSGCGLPCSFEPVAQYIPQCQPVCVAVACDCASPMMVEVYDATNRAVISDASIPEFPNACSGGFCWFGSGPGEYRFTVTAPGYVSQSFVQQVSTHEVDPSPCACDCGVDSVRIVAELQAAQ
jgi:hypothetical protein